MPVSRLDVYYRRMLMSKFFTKGWGDPGRMMRLLQFRKVISERDTSYALVNPDHEIEVLSQETWNSCYVTNGKFKSPFAIQLPDIVHEEVKTAYFQLIVPKKWSLDPYRPVCIHLAGTGDHYFWKRRHLMARPLLQAGIGSIILENPFYGYRKPKEQIRSCLFNVSDIFVMGGCLILECVALLHWCERLGYGPLGITGLSMGGHMASLAATAWPKSLVLVPCLSWTTASSVFTEGVMSQAINWPYLQKQYFSDSRYFDTLAKQCKIVDDPCACGLARIPEFGAVMSSLARRLQKLELRYVTPYELAGFSASVRAASVSEKAKVRHREAVWFMRGLMDECTHLKNFDRPSDPDLTIAISARNDAYVPKVGISKLEEIWPGCSVRHLDCGHVYAYIHYMDYFRSCIIEAFDRAIRKLPPPSAIK